MRTRKIYTVAAITCTLVVTMAHASHQNKIPATVLIVTNLPANYDWSADGSITETCQAGNCFGNINEPSSGTSMVNNKVVSLRLPNGQTLTAFCAMKLDHSRNISGAFLAGMADAGAPTLYRDCRAPTVGETVLVKIDGKHVKLFMGRKSETYTIVEPGPAPTPQPTLPESVKKAIATNSKAAMSSPAAVAAGAQTLTPQEMLTMAQEGQASRCGVYTVPPGAEIDIDGKKAGISPMGFVLLRKGTTPRVVTIKMSGYKTVEKKVVPDGKIIPIGLVLEKGSN